MLEARPCIENSARDTDLGGIQRSTVREVVGIQVPGSIIAGAVSSPVLKPYDDGVLKPESSIVVRTDSSALTRAASNLPLHQYKSLNKSFALHQKLGTLNTNLPIVEPQPRPQVFVKKSYLYEFVIL